MRTTMADLRITVDEYFRMAEIGRIPPEQRVELIEGEVIEMAPIGSPHDSVVSRLAEMMYLALAGRAIVRVQSTLALGQYSALQPDLAIVKRRTDFYRARHPGPADTLLVIEVSESSARYREIKVPLYARHQISEVWLVDLSECRVHFFRAPADGVYAERESTDCPGAVTLAALPEVSVNLTEILAI